MSLKANKTYLTISAISFLIFFFAAPPLFAQHPIAMLTDFSGTVLIKSQGQWAVEPTANLPLYSQDRVVTRIGNAIITFYDGATLEMKANSNLLIQEREKDEGLLGKAKIIERRVLLFLGKLFFRTGRAKIETRFETATAVIGIRGTAGILSISQEGQTYIKFTEGRAAFFIGDFIEGVAKDVPVEIASLSPIQRASFVANAASDQLTRTEEKFAAGLVPKAQVDLAYAIVAETAAREVSTHAKALLTSPDPEVVDEAKQQILEAEAAIRYAKEAQQDAIKDGADPEFKIFTRDDPGFDVPLTPSQEPES